MEYWYMFMLDDDGQLTCGKALNQYEVQEKPDVDRSRGPFILPRSYLEKLRNWRAQGEPSRCPQPRDMPFHDTFARLILNAWEDRP